MDTQELIARNQAAYDSVDGMRVGDFLVLEDGRMARVAHDWGDSVQPSIGMGSIYLGEGYGSYSGGLDPSIPKDRFVDSGTTKPGRFWVFKDNYPRAHNGHDFEMPVRVFVHHTRLPTPNTIEELSAALREKAQEIPGIKVLTWEHGGYNHGPFECIEIELTNGLRAYAELGESQDDEYVIARDTEEER